MPVMNPILARELKERMRSGRTPFVITVYLVLLGALVVLTERAVAGSGDPGSISSAIAGRMVFHVMLFGLLSLVCFMVPGYSAGAIALERERQTFHLVQVTLLRPSRIVLGKLGASFAYLMFLVLITLPFVSVSFILGGVTPLDVVRAYAMIILVGVMLAFLCIAVSSRARRTLGAIVLSYSLVLMLLMGTGVAYGIVRMVQTQQRDAALQRGEIVEPLREPTWTLVLNPFLGLASAIQGDQIGRSVDTPFTPLFRFLAGSSSRGYASSISQGPLVVPQPIPPGAFPRNAVPPGRFVVTPSGPQGIVAQATSPPHRRVPFWVWTVGWYIVLSAVGFLLAVRGVTSPSGRIRSVRQRRRQTIEAEPA